MSKYSVSKRIVSNIPFAREVGANFFAYLPRSLSPYVYEKMRKHIFQDNKKREVVFEKCFAFLRAKEISPKAYLEFGVARGTSIISNYHFAQDYNYTNLPFFAFDSFKGLPESEGGVFEEGTMSYSTASFKRFIYKAGVDLDSVNIVEGFFNESLTEDLRAREQFEPGIYIVHIDCDLYSSTLDALKWVKPMLEKNSIVVFDDWYSFDSKNNPNEWGERKAFYELGFEKDFEVLYDANPWNIGFVRK